MRESETTIAEVFKQNGYATACFGKWHNGFHYPNTPNCQGFDDFLGFCGGHFDNYFDPVLQHNASEIQEHGFISDILTYAFFNFIFSKEECKNANNSTNNQAHRTRCY